MNNQPKNTSSGGGSKSTSSSTKNSFVSSKGTAHGIVEGGCTRIPPITRPPVEFPGSKPGTKLPWPNNYPPRY